MTQRQKSDQRDRLSETAFESLVLEAQGLPWRVAQAKTPTEGMLQVQNLAVALHAIVDHTAAVCADAKEQRGQHDMLVNLLRMEVALKRDELELERRSHHRTQGMLLALIVMVVLYGVVT